MSYILDALRRAEAERDRGLVPGLGAQPMLAPVVPSSTPPLPAVRWLGLGAVIVLTGLLGWWLLPQGEVPPATTAVHAPAPNPTATPTPAPAPAPAPATLPVVVSVPPPPAASSATGPSSPPRPLAAAAPNVPSVTTAMPAPPAAEARTVPLASLTPEQRRDWPPLAIGGAVYSDNPASRFVIIGGQLLREGDVAAPGVTVDRIGPRSAVMRWRDLRVEVPF